MARYRKRPERPVEVEAIRWTGENIEAVVQFMAPGKPTYMAGFSNADDLIGLGTEVATKGDYIVKDSEGNCSCCSADAFEAIYEQVGGGQGA